jgi:fumarate reductase flavoprotein subunit
MAQGGSDFDVVVIGAGGAGLAAASEAARAGAEVLLLDADARTGGSTALSGGVFYAAETSLQRAAGVIDCAEDQFRYYMNVNQHKLEAALVHRLCHESAAAFEWLVSLGVSFPRSGLYCSGVDRVRRGHRAAGHGAEIAAAIEGSFSGLPVDVALNSRVEEIVREAGAVAGVRVGGEVVRAPVVVIASGGFGASPRLLAELYPTAARQAGAWYIGSRHCKGDGLEMGRALGAELAGHDRGLLLMSPGFAQDLEPYLPPWLLHVNHEGRRFVDESTEYSVLAEVLLNQTMGECFAIFDEASRLASGSVPAPNWSADRLADHAQAGRLAQADTLAALAERLGIRPATLDTTVARYNVDVAAGADDGFFKDTSHLRAVAAPPFYGARIRPDVICWTGTGLRIDRDARVLDRADRAIPGLFAAGEATGGMFGQCYAGGGASIANAVIFGRVAGQGAAALAVRG